MSTCVLFGFVYLGSCFVSSLCLVFVLSLPMLLWVSCLFPSLGIKPVSELCLSVCLSYVWVLPLHSTITSTCYLPEVNIKFKIFSSYDLIAVMKLGPTSSPSYQVHQCSCLHNSESFAHFFNTLQKLSTTVKQVQSTPSTVINILYMYIQPNWGFYSFLLVYYTVLYMSFK